MMEIRCGNDLLIICFTKEKCITAKTIYMNFFVVGSVFLSKAL